MSAIGRYKQKERATAVTLGETVQLVVRYATDRDTIRRFLITNHRAGLLCSCARAYRPIYLFALQAAPIDLGVLAEAL